MLSCILSGFPHNGNFDMTNQTRRTFLKRAGGVAAAVAIRPAARGAATTGAAGERIRVGIIGPGGQGSQLMMSFVDQSDVEVAVVCDVDRTRLEDAARRVETKTGKAPKTTGDLRRVLDDPAVDAVIIATPD